MFLWGEKAEEEKCISAQGSSVEGSSQHSSTSGPKVKGGGPLFSDWGPLIMGGWVGKRYYTGFDREHGPIQRATILWEIPGSTESTGP